MTSQFKISENCYLWPTPAGTFFAARNPSPNPMRRLILDLLCRQQTVLLNEDTVARINPDVSLNDTLDTIYQAQKNRLLQGEALSRHLPSGEFIENISEKIETLSSENKAVLADSDGFHISSCGYTLKIAEELAAMAADIWALHKRRVEHIKNEVKLDVNAWGLVDAAGNSQMGFWPLYLGKNHFMLILAGAPQLNQTTFTELVWILSNRYRENN